jgi:hypothetical protein
VRGAAVHASASGNGIPAALASAATKGSSSSAATATAPLTVFDSHSAVEANPARPPQLQLQYGDGRSAHRILTQQRSARRLAGLPDVPSSATTSSQVCGRAKFHSLLLLTLWFCRWLLRLGFNQVLEGSSHIWLRHLM